MSISGMKKLTAFSHVADADGLIRRLMYLRCVDIEKAETGSGVLELSEYDANAERRDAEASLRRVESALAVLYKYSKRKKSLMNPKISVNFKKFVASGSAERARGAVDEVLEIVSKKEEYISERSRLETQIEAMRPYLSFSAPLGIENSKHAFMALGSFPSGMSEEKIDAKLAEADAYAELISEDSGGIYTFVCAYHGDEETARKALSSLGFVYAPFRDMKVTASAASRDAKKRVSLIDAELEKLEERLAKLALLLDKIEVLADMEGTTLAAAEQKLKLVSTDKVVMLRGWVPEEKEDKVRELLESHDCAYDFDDPRESDDPPVLLKNNAFAKNFEWVIGMYAYPKYGAFDPTFIMGIFYFIIFGLMFADVGYGLILSLVCFGWVLWLKPKEGMKRFLLMFGYCGLSSIIMGVLFGGYFGDLPSAIMIHLFGIENPPNIAAWFNPLEDPMTFLILSLAVGAVHIVAGMAVQLYVISKREGIINGILDICPWWILFAGLGLLFVSADVGMWVAIAGVVSLILTQGRRAPTLVKKLIGGVGSLYSLINYISDLLSYSRILALGLVAGVISQVINLITMAGNSFFGFIMMILVLLIGHVLNIAINVLGTFVHTSRLQYIEFFGKFYEDGGRPFNAAKPSDKYTTE